MTHKDRSIELQPSELSSFQMDNRQPMYNYRISGINHTHVINPKDDITREAPDEFLLHKTYSKG